MKKLLAMLCVVAMALCATACGSGSNSSNGSSNDANKSYKIGICQLIQHPALDAATKGFKAYLTEKLGDKVSFTEQNAAGDSAT